MSPQVLLLAGLVMFCLGLYAVVARRHLIGILIGLELMLNAAALNVMVFNHVTSPVPTTGFVIVLFIIGLAAAEAAIALSIVLSVFRSRGEPSADRLQDFKG